MDPSCWLITPNGVFISAYAIPSSRHPATRSDFHVSKQHEIAAVQPTVIEQTARLANPTQLRSRTSACSVSWRTSHRKLTDLERAREIVGRYGAFNGSMGATEKHRPSGRGRDCFCTGTLKEPCRRTMEPDDVNERAMSLSTWQQVTSAAQTEARSRPTVR
jgi:hypothetical protein